MRSLRRLVFGQAPTPDSHAAGCRDRRVVPQGELHGIIRDEQGPPLQGAVVSASVLGSSSVFALSDRDGRYAFRNLPPGAYLVRAFLDGYASPRGTSRRTSRPAPGRRGRFR